MTVFTFHTSLTSLEHKDTFPIRNFGPSTIERLPKKPFFLAPSPKSYRFSTIFLWPRDDDFCWLLTQWFCSFSFGFQATFSRWKKKNKTKSVETLWSPAEKNFDFNVNNLYFILLINTFLEDFDDKNIFLHHYSFILV